MLSSFYKHTQSISLSVSSLRRTQHTQQGERIVQKSTTVYTISVKCIITLQIGELRSQPS